MSVLSKKRLERWLGSLLRINDTPERTSAAFAVGVIVGFSPLVGLHTVIGLALAFAFGLNRVAVLAGVWLNLPWFMAPYYAGATILGGWLTGYSTPPNLVEQIELTWMLPSWRLRMEALGHLVRPLLLPFTLGSTLASLPIGLVSYRVTLAFLQASRKPPSAA
jgi:uncharacterized protein (DUF2062 family)